MVEPPRSEPQPTTLESWDEIWRRNQEQWDAAEKLFKQALWERDEARARSDKWEVAHGNLLQQREEALQQRDEALQWLATMNRAFAQKQRECDELHQRQQPLCQCSDCRGKRWAEWEQGKRLHPEVSHDP